MWAYLWADVVFNQDTDERVLRGAASWPTCSSGSDDKDRAGPVPRPAAAGAVTGRSPLAGARRAA